MIGHLLSPPKKISGWARACPVLGVRALGVRALRRPASASGSSASSCHSLHARAQRSRTSDESIAATTLNNIPCAMKSRTCSCGTPEIRSTVYQRIPETAPSRCPDVRVVTGRVRMQLDEQEHPVFQQLEVRVAHNLERVFPRELAAGHHNRLLEQLLHAGEALLHGFHEQRLLGGEEPEQVRLADARPTGNGIGAGAVEATLGELHGRSGEDGLAPLLRCHPRTRLGHVRKLVLTHYPVNRLHGALSRAGAEIVAVRPRSASPSRPAGRPRGAARPGDTLGPPDRPRDDPPEGP